MFKLENLIGLGFENINELQNFIYEKFENVEFVSGINEPDLDFTDEFVYIDFGNNKIVDLFIAHGTSKRLYIVTVKE